MIKKQKNYIDDDGTLVSCLWKKKRLYGKIPSMLHFLCQEITFPTYWGTGLNSDLTAFGRYRDSYVISSPRNWETSPAIPFPQISPRCSVKFQFLANFLPQSRLLLPDVSILLEDAVDFSCPQSFVRSFFIWRTIDVS